MISRSDAPVRLKALGRGSRRAVGRWTSSHRMDPTFLIIGSQRCGTTSLFRAIAAHPAVVPPTFHKGVHYFDINYTRGMDWYRGHFPLRRSAQRATAGLGRPPASGESSPYYMHHPAGPRRIAAALPGIKLIALLRDPVERAFSAYKHEVARGFEDQPFERALELEESRLEGEVERLLADPGYRSMAHQHQAYVTRGRYAEQLTRVIDAVGRDRLLILESEQFFVDGPAVYRQVLDFLELPDWSPAAFEQHNARPSAPLAAELRARLEEQLQPHDEALAELMGRVPAWRRG
jgi:hypothetical protein